MKCEICDQGPPNGPTVFRVNQPGEMPARWRCRAHLGEHEKLLDPQLVDLVGIIGGAADR